MSLFQQICNGVSTLVHSATMSDVHLDLLDWNLQLHQNDDTNDAVDGTGNVIINHVAEHERSPANLNDASDSDSNVVQSSKSMFTILSTPRKKGSAMFIPLDSSKLMF